MIPAKQRPPPPRRRGYFRPGQSTASLSGGEAQRLKLASFLSESTKSDSGHLFLFDEPTTGLHYTDVAQLIKTFRNLIDRGNSVLVIEHNIQLIEAADHIIDLGPEGGDGGGELLAVGTPEEIAASERSITGHYLDKYSLLRDVEISMRQIDAGQVLSNDDAKAELIRRFTS
jgi:excinuclease ABC subunit A